MLAVVEINGETCTFDGQEWIAESASLSALIDTWWRLWAAAQVYDPNPIVNGARAVAAQFNGEITQIPSTSPRPPAGSVE
jgi:hypothetical protein